MTRRQSRVAWLHQSEGKSVYYLSITKQKEIQEVIFGEETRLHECTQKKRQDRRLSSVLASSIHCHLSHKHQVKRKKLKIGLLITEK